MREREQLVIKQHVIKQHVGKRLDDDQPRDRSGC
jgi:hypothetical protein